MTDVKIFITNLAKYNAGELAGEWVDLPLEEEELKAICDKVLDNTGEELFITDYEADFHIDEYENIFDLNSFVEELDNLYDYDQDKICYLINEAGYDRVGAMSAYEDCQFYPDMDLKEVTEQLVDEGYYGDIPEPIQNYIDYDAIARDLSCQGYHETDSGVFVAP